ncbi:MAG: hypothetical protein QM820_19705 [Minicystis sp.]
MPSSIEIDARLERSPRLRLVASHQRRERSTEELTRRRLRLRDGLARHREARMKGSQEPQIERSLPREQQRDLRAAVTLRLLSRSLLCRLPLHVVWPRRVQRPPRDLDGVLYEALGKELAQRRSTALDELDEARMRQALVDGPHVRRHRSRQRRQLVARRGDADDALITTRDGLAVEAHRAEVSVRARSGHGPEGHEDRDALAHAHGRQVPAVALGGQKPDRRAIFLVRERAIRRFGEVERLARDALEAEVREVVMGPVRHAVLELHAVRNDEERAHGSSPRGPIARASARRSPPHACRSAGASCGPAAPFGSPNECRYT